MEYMLQFSCRIGHAVGFDPAVSWRGVDTSPGRAGSQVNSGLARQMIDKAKEKDLFLTEGLWTRWFPATQKWADETLQLPQPPAPCLRDYACFVMIFCMAHWLMHPQWACPSRAG